MQRVWSRVYEKRGDGRVARELNPLALATAGKQCQPVDAADTNGRCAKRESMSDLVERYRSYAAECVRLAQDVSVLKQKLTLLDMAQSWLALADQALKNAETIESLTRWTT
jgi:hypothetical protein